MGASAPNKPLQPPNRRGHIELIHDHRGTARG
jgi:hypothetical protein